jgi:hypothetical protein
MTKAKTTVGSRQDGEDPYLRTDTTSEIRRPGSHAGAGAPGGNPRPKNREVEDEMVNGPKEKARPPKPATEPDT